MSLNKRIKGNYTIESINDGNDNTITLRALGGNSKVLIDGDLTVIGTQTSVNSTDTNIQDNEIILNAGEIGAGVSAGTAGIIVDRGTATNGNAGIRFNETSNLWEIKNGDGIGWQPIAAGVIGLQDVVDDLTPQLGGDLDVNGWTITSAANGNIVIAANGTGEIRINQELSLQEQATDETPTAGYNKLYAKAVGKGGTGLFVSNNTTVDEVNKRKKAIIYGLIF